FAADGAGADDNHSTRQFCERKDRLVRVITRLRQARYGKLCGPCARSNYGAAKFESCAVQFNRRWADKPPVADVNVHTEFAETVGGIVRADFAPQPPHPLHRSSKIHIRL